MYFSGLGFEDVLGIYVIGLLFFYLSLRLDESCCCQVNAVVIPPFPACYFSSSIFQSPGRELYNHEEIGSPHDVRFDLRGVKAKVSIPSRHPRWPSFVQFDETESRAWRFICTFSRLFLSFFNTCSSDSCLSKV